MRAIGLGVAVLILGAQAASAQGFYFSLQAGPSFLQSADNVDRGTALDIESKYETGYAVGGALGYAFGNGLRVDGEISYRRQSVDRLEIRSDGGLGASLGSPVSFNGATLQTTGSETSLSFMANGWYDFRTGTALTPYVGGGIGLARVSLNDVAVGGFTLVDDHDVVFAWQLGAGLAWAVTPRVSLTLDYRFLATTSPRVTDFEGVRFDSDYHTHNILFGARLGF